MMDSIAYDFVNKKVFVPATNISHNDNEKKRGIIYARVSTEEQRDKGNWINAQIIDCERWARNNNTEIVKVFKDEAISWTDLKRKEFNAALDFVEQINKHKHQIDYFICSSTSRFSRNKNIGKNMELLWRLSAVWVEFVAVWNWWIQEIESETWYLKYNMQSIMDALESMRWAERVRYWIAWKLESWYWPFAWVPAWYKRIVEKDWWKELKILIRDEEMYPILQEWLEWFALWKLITKTDLFNFLDERWFKSNSKVNKTWKFYLSDIDKLLIPWKLWFYAWYIIHPKYVKEPIKWRHTPIIDLDIADKILRKLKAYKTWPDFQKRKYDEDSDDYPLKRVLLCPECNKPVTKRKSLSKTWDYHPYYWCNTKGCPLYRKSLPRDKVHAAVREKIAKLSLSEDLRPLFDAYFKDEWKIEKWDMHEVKARKKKEIAEIEKQMDKIEKSIDNLSNEALIEKKQEQWAELNEKKEELELSLEDITFDKSEFEKVYNDTKVVLFNPVLFRDLWDAEMKQLLIRVLFSWKIYYTKNQECNTPEVSSLYLYFNGLEKAKIPVPGGAENRTPV